MDSKGKKIYDEQGDFYEGMAWVKKDGKYGYIDKTGKEVIKCQYKGAGDFSEGLAVVQNDKGKWGFIDKTGKEIVPCEYEDAGNFYEGLAWVKKGGKFGFIDKSGKIVVPYKFDNVGDFTNGAAKVELGGKVGCVDKSGKYYNENLAGFDEKTKLEDEVLADTRRLKKYKEIIVAIAKADVASLNDEREDFDAEIEKITERTKKIIKSIVDQKTNYELTIKNNKDEQKRIREVKQKTYNALDDLLIENKKGVTND